MRLGNFLSVPHKLQNKINGLPGNAFQIYLLFLRCVTFGQGRLRRPINGTEFFEYPYSRARKHGYAKSKRQFFNGVNILINLRYIKKTAQGAFRGENGCRTQNLYRLIRY